MNKIFLSIVAILAVAAVATTGAVALFSDTETSNDNTYAAGTLDLKVDDKDDPNTVSVDVKDVYPGWSGSYSWTLKNIGSIAGQPSIIFSVMDNQENTCFEPEGDLTCGASEGELGGKLYTLVEWSNDAGASWHALRCSGDYGNHLFNTCSSKTIGLGAFSGVGPGIDTPFPVLNQGEEVVFRLRPWWHLTPTDNIAQSDTLSFDMTFRLDQVTP